MAESPDRTPKTGSEDLARVVRERREELGLTRQELADATGIPYPTIAQIETAYRGVSPARLGVIARVLGLDPKQLYEVLATESVDGAPVADANRQWHANPRFAATRPAPAAPSGPVPRRAAGRSGGGGSARTRTRQAIDEVVDQVVGLLAGLPVDQRVPALGEVQQRVLEQTVAERLAQGE